MREVTFVCCTRAAKEGTDLFRSLTALGVGDIRFFEHNAVGLNTRYNTLIDEYRDADRIVVFAHDDLTIDDPAFREKLNATIDRGWAIAGLAGNATFTISRLHPVTTWLQPPLSGQSGVVRHKLPTGPILVSRYGPTGRRCVVLDGMFLAVHPPTLGAVRFDERFAFHFYDLDFCLAANQAGLALGTTDVMAMHASGGDFRSAGFDEAEERFRTKWGEGGFLAGNPRRLNPGRNEPCYCGSGLRYKHCHGSPTVEIAPV